MEASESQKHEEERTLTLNPDGPEPQSEEATLSRNVIEGSSSGTFCREDSPSARKTAKSPKGNHEDVPEQIQVKSTVDIDNNGIATSEAPLTQGQGDETTKSSNQNGTPRTGGDGTDGRDRPVSSGKSGTADSVESGLLSHAEEQLKKPLPEVLSDVAKFSFTSLVAVCLPNLFDNQWNKAWNLKRVKSLSKYLGLPKRSEETLNIMVQDPCHYDPANADVFLGSLMDDPTLTKPEIIPVDMVSQALQEGTYDARMRVLVRDISKRLGVDWSVVGTFEKSILDCYQHDQHELSEEEKKEREKKAKMRKVKRIAMIGAATIGGGVIIGLTGGLAAPLVASAGAALLGTSLGFFGTVAGAAVLGSIMGAAGAGLSGYKMNKRVGEVEEFEFMSLRESRDLHVTIAISGWLTKDRLDNFTSPWLALDSCQEIYCLRWESRFLLDLGQAIEYILDSVMTMAAKEALKLTVLSGILAAIALPAVAYSAISSSIDNPWSVATSRASEAGKQLAEVLLSRQQGKRPVTLIGFSMGARVIFFCLKELSQRKASEGIIQDVYLLGAPITSEVSQWRPFARVVAGNIVNGYCRGDWLLQFVYRTASMQVSDIAGLEPIRWENRRMVNVDLTEIVNGHLDYSDKMDEILAHVGLRTRDRRTAAADLSTLAMAKERETRKGEEAVRCHGDDDAIVRIDADDLLIPKSASAMDLAVARHHAAVERQGGKDPHGSPGRKQKDGSPSSEKKTSPSSSIHSSSRADSDEADQGDSRSHPPSISGAGQVEAVQEVRGTECPGGGPGAQTSGSITEWRSMEQGEDPLQQLLD